MASWECIDGGAGERWTYPSLGIRAELQELGQALHTRLPQCGADDTAWTAMLSVRMVMQVRSEEKVVALAEAIPA